VQINTVGKELKVNPFATPNWMQSSAASLILAAQSDSAALYFI